jgi:hypothetical protein
MSPHGRFATASRAPHAMSHFPQGREGTHPPDPVRALPANASNS